jgi:hypothetical protein
MAGEEAGAQTAKASGHGLTKKLGPLPIWAWAAVVLGSYLLYHYLKNRNSSAAGSPAGTVAGGTGAPSLGLQIGPGGQIIDPTTGNVIGTVGSPGGTGTNTTTVQGWIAAVQNALQGLGYDNNAMNQALQDYVAGKPLSQQEYNIIESAIKTVGGAPASLGNPILAPTPPTPPAPPVQTPTTQLPAVNSNLWPQIIKYGEWTGAQFTKIGTVNNGQYSGINVTGGVPVYANVFGGLAQGFDMATLPSGTDLYIPTQYLAYENPSGTANVKQAA